MKFLIVLASIVLAISAATDEELWAKFKEQHNREYRNIREEKLRYAVFQNTLRKIEAHNQKYENGETTWFMGVNQFADKTESEIKAMFNASRVNRPVGKNHLVYEPKPVEVAASLNWVEQGVVTEVKDQGQCGSCWAFSVTGTLEGQYAIKYGSLVSLSEQDLVDCSVTYGTAGCNGGYMELAYDYVSENGIDRENDYPYKGTEGSCSHDSSKSVLTVQSYVWVDHADENALLNAAATAGPISISIYAEPMMYYAGGVFDDSSCGDDVDHGVLIAGYGSESGVDYWLIKNSWGQSWGENGYFKLIRNKNNQCGVASYATYPIIN